MPIQNSDTDAAAVNPPDFYKTVSDDMISFCGSQGGRVWVDLGSGEGGLGLAVLAKVPDAVMVLVDADAAALRRGLNAARERGLASRIVPVIGLAERIPLPDECVDVIISRASFCFWPDRAQGLREVKRILRPGGRARLGGGLGRAYPKGARAEFIRKRLEVAGANGPDGVQKFVEVRRPETFRRFAVEAGLSSFEVVTNDGLGPDEPFTGVGTWLQFIKKDEVGR